MAIYKCKSRIGLEDVGYSNKITNKAIIKILENAGGMHSESLNLGLNSIEITVFSWILLGWKVKVIVRPRYNEELTVNTWGRESNRAFTYRDYELYDESGNLCIIATSKWAIVDIKNGHLAEITPELIEPYKCEEKKVFNSDYSFKLKEPETIDREIRYKVQRRDIDINKHVHNLYYLDFAYEALPEEIYENCKFNNIEIMYKRQTKLNDEIKCLYTKDGEQNIVTIKSIDDNLLHAIIKLY